MNGKLEKMLNDLEESANKADQSQWCKDFCYSAIRHVQRNCDIECGTHPYEADNADECGSFGRYDGPYIADACPKNILELISTVREELANDKESA